MTSLAVRRNVSWVQSALRRVGRPSYAIWFPLTVYAVARLIDVVLILAAARHQIAPPTASTAGYFIWESAPPSPSYGSVASNWDGQWYFSIAANGYPTTIPRDAAGHALQSQWGFYPVYPLLVGAVMRITGLAFVVVAPILSTIFGAAALTVMFRLLSQSLGRFAASSAVVCVCAYMAAPVMQIAYTESLGLLLVCTALLLLRNRRYAWLIPVLVTLALTRAVALAFVPVLVVHGISRYRRRSLEPFPVLERWRVAGLTCLGLAATGLWPVIAAVTTGDPEAYTQTMSAWSTTGKLPVLSAFPTIVWAAGGILGVVVLVFLIGSVAYVVWRRGAATWGPEVRAWAGFYPLYLLLATAPGSSNIRHLLLAFPLMWPFPEEPTSTSGRRLRAVMVTVLVISGLLMQWVWISRFIVVTAPPAPSLVP